MLTRTVALEVDGCKIDARLYLPDRDERASYPAVCICHGIPAGGPPDPADGGYPWLAERICREGLAVFIFNFRGTGASGGNLDMLAWSRDLQAAIDYLCAVPPIDRSRIALLGFSGGAAVSLYVAGTDSRISSVVVCACPAEFTLLTRFEDVPSIMAHFRSIGVIRDADFPPDIDEWRDAFKRVSPIDSIAGIAPRRLLLVHGSRDETVDVSHAYRLYLRAGEPRQMIFVGGAGHRLRRDARAMTIVIDWLKSSGAGRQEKRVAPS